MRRSVGGGRTGEPCSGRPPSCSSEPFVAGGEGGEAGREGGEAGRGGEGGRGGRQGGEGEWQ